MNLKPLRIGLARMHAEPGERRDFLPNFVQRLEKNGYHVVLEYGYGSGMGFAEADYLQLAPHASFSTHANVYQQDIVLVLRYPGDDIVRNMQPGSCLISMVHYPTRPNRVALLRELGIEAVSLDSLKDDTGRRLVENLKSVAWNGCEVAFDLMRKVYPAPGFESPDRAPIRVCLLGAGAVGMHVVQAAIHYGDDGLRARLVKEKVAGVKVTVVDYDLTSHEAMMLDILRQTDLLIDATQRPDPSIPVIPNDWIGVMPSHAILLDLSVDPYDFSLEHPSIKGIEGIPQGNLDKYIFAPPDGAFDALPSGVTHKNRRHAISCYSWPGLHPQECMRLYGYQLRPLMRTIFEAGDLQKIQPHGNFFQRAISRAMVSRWQEG